MILRHTPQLSAPGARAIASTPLSTQSVEGVELPTDTFENGPLEPAAWKPTATGASVETSPPVLKRLRRTGIRMALQVAMAASAIGPLLTPAVSMAQNSDPEIKKERVLNFQDAPAQDGLTYQLSAQDFHIHPQDSVKQKSVKPLLEQPSEKTEPVGDDEKATLLGYEIDTKFAKVSASPKYKDGALSAKVKASAVRFSAKKEWTLGNGTQVRRGFTTRLRYEGEGTYSPEAGFGFESKHLDTEIGLEQRYDKIIGQGVHFSHRYFVGGRHRYRFSEQKGSEFQAVVQTEQKAYQNDAFHLLGQNFGWEAGAKQTFVTNWGAVEGNGGQATFALEGLVTKKVNLKLLGKVREFRLKAGPEFRYSTRHGFSLRPEVGVKVKL